MSNAFSSQEKSVPSSSTPPGTCCTRARLPASTSTAMYLRADHVVCCCSHASGGVSTYIHASHNHRFDDNRRADYRSTCRRRALLNNITQVLIIRLCGKIGKPPLNHTFSVISVVHTATETGQLCAGTERELSARYPVQLTGHPL